jgi:hypothetical protein
MRPMHPCAATALFSLLCFAGCDQAAQAPLSASPSTPTVPRPAPSPANPAVLVARLRCKLSPLRAAAYVNLDSREQLRV